MCLVDKKALEFEGQIVRGANVGLIVKASALRAWDRWFIWLNNFSVWAGIMYVLINGIEKPFLSILSVRRSTIRKCNYLINQQKKNSQVVPKIHIKVTRRHTSAHVA